MILLSANLQAFTAIVETGTVHAAAARIGLTQTAVTQRIRALEKELRSTLFLRSRKGMQLTEEGKALHRYCLGATALEGQALSQIQKSGAEAPARVLLAGPTSVITARVAAQCAPLYARFPQLQLSFLLGDAHNRIDLLRTGEASLSIVAPEEVPNEMDSKMLHPDRYLLVASAKWKGRRLTDILEHERVIDFEERDPTTLNYLKKFKLLPLLKQQRLYVNGNEVLIDYFRRGIGFGTLTQEIAKPHLESGALIALNGGAAMEDPLALAWYPRPEMPVYFKELIASIK